ncbi:MAG: hypothetical protein HY320_06935 [Armatimonadetes bacterium]|nr:hypothetical protein [Armatimonadota bacterium]
MAAARDRAGVADVPYEAAERARVAPGGGANLMLAFVCWVAGLTALYEALSVAQPVILIQWQPLGITFLPSVLDWAGYLMLGLGIPLFSLEAIYWARRPRWLNFVLVPAWVLTVAGIICLVQSQTPGRRI